MRPESKRPVLIRGKVLGGRSPLICLPLVAKDTSALMKQARVNAALAPDVIEWRVDGFEKASCLADMREALEALRSAIGEIPLIFTCRYIEEGGFRDIPQDVRTAIIVEALKSGAVDVVDYEIACGEELIAQIKEETKKAGAKLILSYHNFKLTPEEDFIRNRLMEAQDLGADIAKLAVMPNNYRDVLNLLSATLSAREGGLDLPIISMSMGEIGKITRIAGGFFGSDLTFAVGAESSAPGQVPAADLRSVWRVLSL